MWRQNDGTGSDTEIESTNYRYSNTTIMCNNSSAILFFGAGAYYHIAFRQVSAVRHRYKVNKAKPSYSLHYKVNCHTANNGNLSAGNSLFQNG